MQKLVTFSENQHTNLVDARTKNSRANYNFGEMGEFSSDILKNTQSSA